MSLHFFPFWDLKLKQSMNSSMQLFLSLGFHKTNFNRLEKDLDLIHY